MNKVKIPLICPNHQNPITIYKLHTSRILNIVQLNPAQKPDKFVVIDIDKVDICGCYKDIMVD